jgi:hypothetical protein
MKDNILRNAEMFINVAEVKQATEDMKEFVQLIASTAMEMYKGFIEERFNEQQAL